MIRGIVNSNLTAMVEIEVLGAHGTAAKIAASVDSGFNGYVALAPDLIRALSLRPIGFTEGTLADGGKAQFDTYVATVDWHGTVRSVMVIESDGGNLLGMALLNSSRLVIDVREGGLVTIERL